MNSFDLTFLKYLQENQPLALDEAVTRFGKTHSTLKRSMKTLNEFLPAGLELRQENQFLVTRLRYPDYIRFLETLPFNRYLTTAEERIRELLVAFGLHGVVNKNEHYKTFHISPGTLKNDAPLFSRCLAEQDLSQRSLARKGTELAGDEFRLRVAVCMAILKAVETGEDHQLIAHKANDPISRMIAGQFLTLCAQQIQLAARIYQSHLHPHWPLGYNGKKYFLVYLSLALYRQSLGYRIQNTQDEFCITSWPWGVFEDAAENERLDLLVASLTTTDKTFSLYDPPLLSHVRDFCQQLSGSLKVQIQDPREWLGETYTFLYSAIIQSKFHLGFDDKKLHQVEQRYIGLYQQVQQALTGIESQWGVHLSAVHVATLVLIVKKHELKNRLRSERRKRVIIVSNSSESKVGYFKEVLHSWFHVEIPLCVNINELHRLQDEPFDLLLTFTNKISTYLHFAGYEDVKVNFHLTQQDIALLHDKGLSRARKKIPAGEFIRQVEGLDKQQLQELLLREYADIFI